MTGINVIVTTSRLTPDGQSTQHERYSQREMGSRGNPSTLFAQHRKSRLGE
ncbi:hypothetical protein Atai01_12120 [Amycolatopsis taiwanensis]|uniref:Uncharacterized protein n=1 Tax=Amycolatopsis taiwanensis TaxID=342230 RepID=A0A9W6QVP4_9PSEU|nr:hypothetical protein Atai01_12120 [Amycolatopsis taiwanensis]